MGDVDWFCVDYKHKKQIVSKPNLKMDRNQTDKSIDIMICKEKENGNGGKQTYGYRKTKL